MQLEQNDETGIFLAILYLAREAEDRGMLYGAAKLIEAAHAVTEDCKKKPKLHSDLKAAMKVYTDFSSMDEADIIKVLERMNKVVRL